MLRSASLGLRKEGGRTSKNRKGGLVTEVAKGDASTGSELEVLDLGGRHVEGDRHREKNTVGEAEGLDDAAR